MNDDLPSPFGRLALRPPPDELRARVLDALAMELETRVRPRLERTIEWAIAASLVLGIGLNLWQQRAEAAWQMRVYGRAVTPRSIVNVAQTVASVTDAHTGEWVQRRLSESRATLQHARSARGEQYQRLLHDVFDKKARTTL